MKRKSSYKPIFGLAGCLLASVLLVNAAYADGTEALGPPSIDIAEGSGILVAGTGLYETNQPGQISIDIPAGLTVNQVLLYWTGRTDSGDPGASDTIKVNNEDVTGPRIGGPTPIQDNKPSHTYRADITASNWVTAGAVNVLTVDALDFNLQNDGAAVVVIWDDGSTADIRIADGNDFAYLGFNMQTTPVVFPLDPSDEEQMAYVWLIAGDVAAPRPNAVDITVDGDTTSLTNVFDDNLGAYLDVVELEVPVPAGTSNVTVQVLSVDDGSGNDPASLSWMFVAWELPGPPEDEGCTYTIGYWKNHYEDWPAEFPDGFIYNEAEAKELLQAPSKGGNAYIILAHQYIGAALNVGNGTSIPPEVADVWTDAGSLLDSYKLDPVTDSTIPKKTDDRDDAIDWATTLDYYNNGELGPGHCD